jgi:hypothetical protein
MDRDDLLEIESSQYACGESTLHFDDDLPLSKVILGSRDETISSDISLPTLLNDTTTLKYRFQDVRK